MNEQEVYCVQETKWVGSTTKNESHEFPEALWLEQEPSSCWMTGNSRNQSVPLIAPSFLAGECKLCWERLSTRHICHLAWHAVVLARMVAFAEMLEGADWKLRLFSTPRTQSYCENPLWSRGLEVECVSINVDGKTPMDCMVGRYSHHLVVGVESEKVVSEALYIANKEGQLPPEQI